MKEENKEARHKRFDELFVNGKKLDENTKEYTLATPDNLKSFIDTEVDLAVAEAYQRAVDEIIEDIPLCRDRITKCNCRDHDVNEEVFDYLQALKGEEIK